ncbi:HetZ-related protein 2 [Planktothrix agardhii]|jgi:DNA-binding NarL/FixJ family response regulator|uniref:HetZ-related protein 2 n=1 Tax=Planktothrix agardhii TaxID=1160 RepID=UPI00333F8EE7
MTLAESWTNQWRFQLENDYPNSSQDKRESIINWLLGEHFTSLDSLPTNQQERIKLGLNFRYQILQQRYLDTPPEKAYRNLMQRLGSLMILRQKVRLWVSTSRDRQRQVVDVLQEVVQEMLNSDRYLQQQIQWISQCTNDRQLSNALLFTTLEEYCLRPIRNQPLLVYRFVNYLRRSQRGGLTQVPAGEWIKQLSDEILSDETDDTISLLDNQAISQYEDDQYFQTQQNQRLKVQAEFEDYLIKNVDSKAAEWLRLYLQGLSQEAIAQKLNLPIKQIYRLREKVSYHAIKNFTLKQNPELVTSWLGTSLSEHRLGLKSEQWEQFWQSLNDNQRQIIERLKAGETLETIAETLNLKLTQIQQEWTTIYLMAQDIRN